MKKRSAQAWAEAKKLCRLNEADIRMAKELGMTPKSLIKNIPAPNQQWKAPVKEWVRDVYEDKFGRVITGNLAHSERINEKPKKQEKTLSSDFLADEDLPF